MRQDRHYQGIRGEIMFVSSPTDSSSSNSEGLGKPCPFFLPVTVQCGHRGEHKDMAETSFQYNLD